MKKYVFLGILVIFPIFVFVFLQGFGSNSYPLDIYHTRWIEEVEVEGEPYLDTVIDPSQLADKKIVDTLYHQIPPFVLTDQNGERFNSETLKGNIYVADFFFTTCGNPSLCPRMSAELSRVQSKFADREDFKIISFTVDPETDRPEVLKEYAGRYQAQEGLWYFLTGEKKKIYELAYRGFKVNAMAEQDEIGPDFLHAIKFMLVDKEGRIRGYYVGNDQEEVDRLILEIKILFHEYQ